MKLLRLVTAYFEPGLDGWSYWVSKIGRVTVRARLVNRTDIPQEQQTNRARLLMAEINLPSIPKPDSDGLLDIPQQERQICEYAIEAVANLVSVLTRSPRKLSSPWPPVALIPEGEEEWKALEGARAFRYRSGRLSTLFLRLLSPSQS